jgi:hypothetical protein
MFGLGRPHGAFAAISEVLAPWPYIARACSNGRPSDRLRRFFMCRLWLDRATIQFRVFGHCGTSPGSFCGFGAVLSSPAHGPRPLAMDQIENEINGQRIFEK